MVNQNADVLVITTSSFSQDAIKFADEVNVRLMDGEQFLDMWLQSISKTVEEIGEGYASPLTPLHA